MMDLLSTIEHTGTHSYLEEVGHKMEQQHCSYLTPEQLEKYRTIYTTYRDPYRVGASWANRYDAPLDDHKFNQWCRQWGAWAELDCRVIVMKELKIRANAFPDRLGLHEALDNGDMEHYHSYVPQRFITFAQQCVEQRGLTNGDFIR